MGKISNKYKALLKETNYIKESTATLISRFGDGVDTIAFSWLVYSITGSTLLVATLFAVNGLPSLIFGICSGVICKYIAEKKIMAICDFGRGICVAIIALLSILGNLKVWHLYVITFMNSSFEAFRSPASTSIFPEIISKENIDNGIALCTSLNRISELLGYAIAPILIATVGLGGTIMVDSVTFIICGVIILTLKVSNKIKKDNAITIKGCFTDLKEGFKYIVKDKFILNVCLFSCVINALIVPYNALLAPYAVQVLKKGNEVISIMSITLVLGMSIGSLFVPKLKELIGGHKVFILGGWIIGLTYCILSLLGKIPSNLVYLSSGANTLIMGFGIVFLSFVLQIAMFKRISQEYLARVASLFNALALCAAPITSCIVGLVSKMITLEQIFLIFGIIILIIFTIQIFNKHIKEFNKC
ncbi:MFS transporter [Haloimpatiens massiliensis]|uniref:MFS transporter n=1 Tax=Haloimpatiens massiliensis TaxID=1658110 RepID=UPI000C85D9A8|nr:MFS transporter [Haloimpatiens massiliensis]